MPELVEKDVTIQKAKVNADVRPDQIRVKITGSEELKKSGANYIKVYLPYGDGEKEQLEDAMEIGLEEKVMMFTIPGANAANVVKSMRDREISFTLKKKKMLFCKVDLDT